MQANGESAPLVDPDEYARLVRAVSDEDLQRGLEENGELILEQIFASMPSQLRHEATAGVSLVAEWRIRDVGDHNRLCWQVVINDRTCHVQRDGKLSPDVVFTVGGVEFIKLVTGNAHGPLLFLRGRLKIRGDLLKAARFQGYFRAARPDRDGRGDSSQQDPAMM